MQETKINEVKTCQVLLGLIAGYKLIMLKKNKAFMMQRKEIKLL